MDIFNFININGNDYVSKINDSDKIKLLKLLHKYKISLRDELDLDKDITYGMELEFKVENNSNKVIESKLKSLNYKLLLDGILDNCWWDFKEETSLTNGYEITSPIFRNKKDEWIQLKEVCNIIKNNNGEINEKTAGHIHIGSQILGSNKDNWLNFFKLYIAYENLIYRFSYGEYESGRNYTNSFAAPTAHIFYKNLEKIDDTYTLYKILKLMHTEYKRKGISFYKYDNKMAFEKDRTIEFRMPNATLEPTIWQNNVNFFSHILTYCKNDNFDMDLILKRIENNRKNLGNLPTYVSIDIEEAFELSDLIFDNNLDKINFLRQYFKNFTPNGEFIKTKTFIKK